MPEVNYDDRSDEPEWRLPLRTEPGIVGRAIAKSASTSSDENQHATHPGRPTHSVDDPPRGVDDSEYRFEREDWTPNPPGRLLSVALLSFSLGVLVTSLAVILIILVGGVL